MSTQLDIAALRALRKKATPGEWTDAGSKIGAEGYGIAEVDFDNEHDVPYVVALVNAAPALLDAYDERDRLRAEVERLQSDVARQIKTDPDPDWMVWSCKIAAPRAILAGVPRGSDAPMRRAVRDAFERVAGADSSACFSGWNGHLTDGERAVIEPDLRAALTPPSGGEAHVPRATPPQRAESDE